MSWMPDMIDLIYDVHTDCDNESEYPDKEAIIQYLKKGTVDIAASGSAIDAITGEKIKGEYVGMNDGTYHWWSTTVYYVERYGLRLPENFVRHVLEKKEK